jgi:cytosine/adenosine deaminase-related metal-dependent hydrolase
MNLDPPGITRGGLRSEGDTIVGVGPDVVPHADDEIVDCRGAVVLPGLVNGHTHLYSTLATGMPQPLRAPTSFEEILERVWWRLDRALDVESIEISGTIGALDALHCGTTTLIDHHASPNCIAGSLDLIERGVAAVGLGAVLCYETSDRNGQAGTAAGLEENRRYLEKRRNVETSKRQNVETSKRQNVETSKRQGVKTSESQDAKTSQRAGAAFGGRVADGEQRFGALVGAHAAFTLADDSLRACADLAAEFQTGVHIHVAEDPCDDRICRERYGAPLVDRLRKFGMLDAAGGAGDTSSQVGARSILAHGTHLSPEEATLLGAQVGAVAHNPRSNMNNRVGYAPVVHMANVLLGTDGIGSDMFTEARFAWFKACDAAARATGRSPLGPADVVAMLAHSARVASILLCRTLGRLVPGAAADVVITDYRPATALDSANAVGHFIFALGPQHVRHVLAAGRWALRDHVAVQIDEPEARRRAVPLARALWSRMSAI